MGSFSSAVLDNVNDVLLNRVRDQICDSHASDLTSFEVNNCTIGPANYLLS